MAWMFNYSINRLYIKPLRTSKFALQLMKNVLIVDDHTILRHGLKLLIVDFYPGSEITEAQDEGAAIEILKKKSFDLVLLDVQMPGSNCFDVLNFIVSRHPNAKVLIYSMGSETLYGKSFLKAGAHGYLSKDAPMKELQKAIETILSGKKYISTNLVNSLINDVANGDPDNPFLKLSPRETEIAHFLLEGLTVSEICTRVNLQSSTVGTHKTRIFEKLGVSNVMQMKDLALLYQF
jgi:two-component system, NarL family, invasion response regulator UvrY